VSQLLLAGIVYTNSHNYSNTETRRTTNSLNLTMVFDNVHEHSSQNPEMLGFIFNLTKKKKTNKAKVKVLVRYAQRSLYVMIFNTNNTV